MKIDEFIKKVNQNDRMEAETFNGVVAIYDDSEHEVLNIPFYATNLLEIKYMKPAFYNSFGKSSRKYLSALIEELLHTPVKNRFPEKKYVLSAMRNVEGPVPIKQYVNGMHVSDKNTEFQFGYADDKDSAMKFTQQGLDNLSQWFPEEAIEAMKEPVEDE